METYPMEFRLEPRERRVVFRLADPADAPEMDPEMTRTWHEFFWAPITGWLDRRRLTDEQVADWIPLSVESGARQQQLDDVLVEPEQHKIAIRIPKHADHSGPADGHPNYQWLAWWLSEAGLTVELLTDEAITGWMAAFVEGEPDG